MVRLGEKDQGCLLVHHHWLGETNSRNDENSVVRDLALLISLLEVGWAGYEPADASESGGSGKYDRWVTSESTSSTVCSG